MKRMRVICLMCVCLMVLAFCVPAFASDVRTGTAVDSGSTPSATVNPSSSMGDYVNDTVGDLVPNVTTNDIVERLENKGNDVVRILQTVGKYVCIGAFVVCCFLILFGLFGNKQLLCGAVIGCIVSGIAYAGIVCGREIVNWVAAWAVS